MTVDQDFINAYIESLDETAVSFLRERIHLKAQIKQKDKLISELQAGVRELQTLRDRVEELEAGLSTMDDKLLKKFGIKLEKEEDGATGIP